MAKDSGRGTSFVQSSGPGIQLPDFDHQEIVLDKKDFEYDVNKEMEEMLKGARQKEQSNAVDFKLRDFDMPVPHFVKPTELEKLLAQAKELMSQKNYQKAFSKLQKVLNRDAVHHEAIYLMAFCQEKLKQRLPALRTLAPIRHAALNPQLKARIGSLRGNIRAVMMVEILLSSLRDPRGMNRPALISQLEDLVKLDPEFDIYHYLLGANLLKSGAFKQALEAVMQGLQTASHEGRMLLENLKKHIEKEHLNVLLKPAINAYKKGQYRKARSKLNRVNDKYKISELFRTFQTYLKQLNGGGLFSFFCGSSNNKTLPRASGKRENVTELYFLIIKDEIDQGFLSMLKGNLQHAESLFRQAVSYTPHFSFINYTVGGCIFNRVMAELVTSKAKPNIDAVYTDLEAARSYAQKAADDDSAEEIKLLLKTIDSNLDQIEKIKAQVEESQYETKIINRNVEPFNKVMQALNSGSMKITSDNQLQGIKDMFRNMKGKAQSDRNKVASREAKKALNDLISAIDNVLNQLSSY